MDFLDRTLENFREYLKENTDSKNTVKNYVSDLRIFLIFLDSRHSPITAENFPLSLNTQTLSEFESYLSVINPPATLNRRVSSVKKFFDYYLEHHPLPPKVDLPPVTFSSPLPTSVNSFEPPIPTPEPEPVPEIVTVQPEPSPAIIESAPDSNGNLLRLLPEEITENEKTMSVGHRSPSSPANIFNTYKVGITCTISFLVGFFSTMAIYPILYP